MNYKDILLKGYNAPLAYTVGGVSFECYQKPGAKTVYVKDNVFVREISEIKYENRINRLTKQADKETPYFSYTTIDNKSFNQYSGYETAAFGLFSFDPGTPCDQAKWLASKLKGISLGEVLYDPKEKKSFTELGGIYMSPDLRRFGYTRLLIQAQIEWAQNKRRGPAAKMISRPCADNRPSCLMVENMDFKINETKREKHLWGSDSNIVGYTAHYELDLNNYKPIISRNRL